MCAADKLQEMDDLVWSDKESNLNLTAMLDPIMHKVHTPPSTLSNDLKP